MTRCSRGNSRRKRDTVSITLAPGWRWMSITTAGLPWYQPPTRAFSSPSMTSATSRNCTGAPFR